MKLSQWQIVGLAVLPLFFAWRSLPSYFACAAFPMFILLASRGNSSRGSQPRNTPIIQGPAHGQPDEVVRQATEVARERELAALV